ncbi:hypothetical protein TNIN_334141 [Trichonephila inaurata madagascariensis]|uniref:Uncharacterized protein n=1 Tax=Trichonephila inaurata madagascariensis TaxID=2747483 RepID=A0A8X7CDG7_9ARAC|nr:hypothetical protein TNIN_334141 [Trichonephila inaurata madagascariensis]
MGRTQEKYGDFLIRVESSLSPKKPLAGKEAETMNPQTHSLIRTFDEFFSQKRCGGERATELDLNLNKTERTMPLWVLKMVATASAVVSRDSVSDL